MDSDIKLIDARCRILYEHEIYEPYFSYSYDERKEMHDFAPDLIPDPDPKQYEQSIDANRFIKRVESEVVSIARWQIGQGEIQTIGTITKSNGFAWDNFSVYPIAAYENNLGEEDECALNECIFVAEQTYFKGLDNTQPWIKDRMEAMFLGETLKDEFRGTMVFERYDNPLFAYGCVYNYARLWTPDEYGTFNEWAMAVIDDNGNPHLMLEHDYRYPPGSIELL